MSKYVHSDNKDLQYLASNLNSKYQSANPFPHITIDNFFNTKELTEVLLDFPDLSTKETKKHDNPREKKLGSRGEMFFGEKTKEFLHYLNSEPFLKFIQTLTGIEETLLPDPYFTGGGQHEIKPGGLLKLHADFNKHPLTKLDRRVNLLVYLNRDWQESFGGHLELWDKDMIVCQQKILPLFNRITIFSTTDFSYHGHPDPLTCPASRSRKSIALYYFSNGRPTSEINSNLVDHGTIFRKRMNNKEDKRAFSLLNVDRLKELIADFVPPILIKMKNRFFD